MAARTQHRLTPDTAVGPGRHLDTVEECLRRAHHALTDAARTTDVPYRYARAHVAALRAAAALLAVRARPAGRSSQRNAWELLVRVAPELTEWALLFSAGARKRSAAEAGLSSAVSAREADDQLRDAERFLAVIEKAIGGPQQLPFGGHGWSA